MKLGYWMLAPTDFGRLGVEVRFYRLTPMRKGEIGRGDGDILNWHPKRENIMGVKV